MPREGDLNRRPERRPLVPPRAGPGEGGRPGGRAQELRRLAGAEPGGCPHVGLPRRAPHRDWASGGRGPLLRWRPEARPPERGGPRWKAAGASPNEEKGRPRGPGRADRPAAALPPRGAVTPRGG